MCPYFWVHGPCEWVVVTNVARVATRWRGHNSGLGGGARGPDAGGLGEWRRLARLGGEVVHHRRAICADHQPRGAGPWRHWRGLST
jgi:hypothetical protein